MSNVLYRATKYMNAEDALLAREEKPRNWERQEDTQVDRGWKMARTRERREDRRFKPPTGGLNIRSRDTYCRFHCDHGHDTADCYDLKQQIEALIRQGKLQRFVSKNRTNPPQDPAPRRENERPRPLIRDIRMIIRGTAALSSSKKAGKMYLRMVHSVQLAGTIPKMRRISNLVVEFSEEDAWRLHHPHDDAIVVTLQVGDYNMH
ncbi:uncharacterized protein LOC142639697 [Castanea sativa]|uniref:uncharacterized protein LOC142639697 n=1 Tax=Castanea sativa TaxID=21020 RepID=UPI003F651B64